MNKQHTFTFYAYPKINLGLNVFKKEIYEQKHKLESIFILIKNDVFDTINIKINEQKIDEVNYVQNAQTICIENDLITKTLSFFRKHYQLNETYFKIDVDKKIPMHAGLGGASADAGCVINFLITYFNIGLTDYLIKKIALELGSDICFFLYNYEIALVSEYGNKVQALNLKLPTIKIIANDFQCSTKNVYQAFDQYYLNHQLVFNNYQEVINHWSDLKNQTIVNNLQAVVFDTNQALYVLYNRLIKKYPNIYLTGSGSFFITIIE